MKALIIDQINPCVRELLSPIVDIDERLFLSQDALCEIIGDYDILIMRQNPAISAKVIEAGRNLKMIACHCVGTNHIDLECAKKHNILVTNAAGLNSNAVAELALAKMLEMSRWTIPSFNDIKYNGVFNKFKWYGHEVTGKTLGLIGLGRIGRRLNELTKPFHMRVLCYDPYITKEAAAEIGVEKMELDELLPLADFITIHVPLTPETKGLFSADRIAQMKSTGVLLNMSRGGIVDEDAMYEALRDKRVGGYGADVMTAEMQPGGIPKDKPFTSPLFEFDNFILTPHIAGLTMEADDAIGHCVVEKVREFVKH